MQPGGARLAVDCGGVSVAGVLTWPNGQWTQLDFDGFPSLPAAVWVAADRTLVTGAQLWHRAEKAPQGLVNAPLRRLREDRIAAGGSEVEPAELVAALLRHVGSRAGSIAGAPVDDVRLVVPAAWGPVWRTRLRKAAERAGLGSPSLIEAPAAAAGQLLAEGIQLPVGSFLAVCDLGGGCEASVLRRGPFGFEILSTITASDAAGDRLDRALVELLTQRIRAGSDANTPPPGPGEQVTLLAVARHSLHALAKAPAVTLGLPGTSTPTVLTAADVAAIAAPVWAQAAQATVEAIAAAEVPAGQVQLCCIGGACTPAAAEAIAAATGCRILEVADPAFAAVRGAVGITAATTGDHAGASHADAAATVVVGPPLPPIRRALGLVVPGLASLALVAHFLLSGRIEGVAAGGQYGYLAANWGELALAAVATMITALGAATLIAATMPVQRHPDGGTGNETGSGSASGVQQIGTGLLGAVAAGLAVAGMYALTASVYFATANGPFLRWALLPVLPIGAAAVTTAVLATRSGRIPAEGWHAWLHFPTTALVLAAAGMLLVQISLATAVIPERELALQLLGRLGAGLLGAGTAVAIARRLQFRLIIGAPLAIFTAAIVTWRSTGMLAILFVAGATWWWAWQVWRLLRPARIGRLLNRPGGLE